MYRISRFDCFGLKPINHLFHVREDQINLHAYTKEIQFDRITSVSILSMRQKHSNHVNLPFYIFTYTYDWWW